MVAVKISETGALQCRASVTPDGQAPNPVSDWAANWNYNLDPGDYVFKFIATSIIGEEIDFKFTGATVTSNATFPVGGDGSGNIGGITENITFTV
jgi:hypothetical protein